MPNIQACGYPHRKTGECTMVRLYALTPPQTHLLHAIIVAIDVILDTSAEASLAAVVKRWV